MLQSSRSEKGRQCRLPFSDDLASTWKLPYGGAARQGNMRIWTDVHVLLNLIYSFFIGCIFLICNSLFSERITFCWLVLRACGKEKRLEVEVRKFAVGHRRLDEQCRCGRMRAQCVEKKKFFLISLLKMCSSKKINDKDRTCAWILCSTQYWRCLPVMLDCSNPVYILHRLLLRQKNGAFDSSF